jgi:hypothetical protein
MMAMVALITVKDALQVVETITGSRASARLEMDHAFRGEQMTLVCRTGTYDRFVPVEGYKGSLWLNEDGSISPNGLWRVAIDQVKEDEEGRQWIVPATPVEAEKPEWFVLENELRALCMRLAGGDQEARGRKRGRKVKFQWDYVFGEFLRRVHEEGLPDLDRGTYQVEAERLYQFCLDQFDADDDVPSIETLRKKIPIWLEPVLRHK